MVCEGCHKHPAHHEFTVRRDKDSGITRSRHIGFGWGCNGRTTMNCRSNTIPQSTVKYGLLNSPEEPGLSDLYTMLEKD